MNLFTGEKCPTLHSKWFSVMDAGLMWPGEYQNAVDSCGSPHHPWGVHPLYFECCTGTPCADNTRASAFLATDMSPTNIAKQLGEALPFRPKILQVQERDGDKSDNARVIEGSVTLFSIHRQDDKGVRGTICIITAFSHKACEALASHGTKFKQGTFTIVPHGRFKSTIQTKLGPKRLVHVVGINKDATDSAKLAAIFTVEDDAAVAYQPCPADDHLTLADHVIARGVLAFHNGGLDSCISPTIESIMARRDYHGHDLTRSLFSAVERWFRSEWTLDVKQGARMLLATQLTNAIVDGVPISDGGRGGGNDEAGSCRGLAAVTDRQLMYETLCFCINPPGECTFGAMMSAIYPKEDEAMKMYLPSKYGFGRLHTKEQWNAIRIDWRSCDYCLNTESRMKKLKVCKGCVCERYFAGRYCSKRCQKKDRPRHELTCGKTRSEIQAAYDAFCDGDFY